MSASHVAHHCRGTVTVIQGPTGSPYAGGSFKLEILVPDRYPFEPPKIRFITPIYHPNIDSGGASASTP